MPSALMSRCLRVLTLVGVGLLGGATASAQGIVQEREHRPPPMAEAEGCTLWRGDIHGNDPSAEITVRLCTRGDRVTGSFVWSSLESGWNHRTLEGEWRDGQTLLVARDTAMVESHPLHGWTLCTADSYVLRVVGEGRLEGSYASERCHDHGRLTMTQREAPPAPAAAQAKPSPATQGPTVLPHYELTPGARHAIARCSARPGSVGSNGVWGALAGIVGLALVSRRRARR